MNPSTDTHVLHVMDLSVHEQRRLAAVLEATPDHDPGAVLADESAAWRLLYSGLDAAQRATLRLLREAGVTDA